VLSRRALLGQGALAAAGFLAASCVPQQRTFSVAPRRRLAKVRVEEDRLIRMVAGLRPYRAGGFVVRTEKLDDRLIVHNYGHGGGGITLSWGSALLAADMAQQSSERVCAVLGCGALGLTTARILQDRGFSVTIYARDLPPLTTSNVAGGQWGPFTVFEAARATPGFVTQFEQAARLAHRRFQTLPASRYGVRWIEHYVLRDAPPPVTRNDPLSDILEIDSEVLAPGEHQFDYGYVRRFYSMLVETGVFLDALTEDLHVRGGRIVVRQFRDKRELLELPERLIVNCTGLGSRELFGDSELVPLRGQLAILLPQPEVDYIILAGPSYMFPRSDGILLGGTREPDAWSTDPDPDRIRQIITGHASIMERMRP
jgi:glycine/D-amino acid oxidase-like deaminating enzyme